MANEVHPKSEEVVMTLAEQLRREGREQGREQGRVEGRELGLRQGSRQEAADALLRVLALRFSDVPEWARARIEVANLQMLRDWLEKAVVRERLDEVF
jgi:predicted transposase YdaD